MTGMQLQNLHLFVSTVLKQTEVHPNRDLGFRMRGELSKLLLVINANTVSNSIEMVYSETDTSESLFLLLYLSDYFNIESNVWHNIKLTTSTLKQLYQLGKVSYVQRNQT